MRDDSVSATMNRYPADSGASTSSIAIAISASLNTPLARTMDSIGARSPRCSGRRQTMVATRFFEDAGDELCIGESRSLGRARETCGGGDVGIGVDVDHERSAPCVH